MAKTSVGSASDIVKAAIYPPIGIARVGNSEDEFFLAPEVPNPLPEPPGFYRDAEGALKHRTIDCVIEHCPDRQASKGRITVARMPP